MNAITSIIGTLRNLDFQCSDCIILTLSIVPTCPNASYSLSCLANYFFTQAQFSARLNVTAQNWAVLFHKNVNLVICNRNSSILRIVIVGLFTPQLWRVKFAALNFEEGQIWPTFDFSLVNFYESTYCTRSICTSVLFDTLTTAVYPQLGNGTQI